MCTKEFKCAIKDTTNHNKNNVKHRAKQVLQEKDRSPMLKKRFPRERTLVHVEEAFSNPTTIPIVEEKIRIFSNILISLINIVLNYYLVQRVTLLSLL